jgi:hypothetical protein
MAAAPLRHLRLAALAAAALTAASYDNGSGWRLPVMGWNSWCTDDFCGLLDLCFEAEIHEIADAMNASGMVAAGYRLLEVREAAGRGRGARFARHTRPRPRPHRRRRPRPRPRPGVRSRCLRPPYLTPPSSLASRAPQPRAHVRALRSSTTVSPPKRLLRRALCEPPTLTF